LLNKNSILTDLDFPEHHNSVQVAGSAVAARKMGGFATQGVVVFFAPGRTFCGLNQLLEGVLSVLVFTWPRQAPLFVQGTAWSRQQHLTGHPLLSRWELQLVSAIAVPSTSPRITDALLGLRAVRLFG
jgi:hypothetical protein